MLIKFYDDHDRFTYCKSSEEVNPFSQGIKNHFYYGGSVVLENSTDKIGDHNTLNSLINNA